MRPLSLSAGARPLERVLCIGAPCGDMESGCSGTVLSLIDQHPDVSVTWVVLASDEGRARETLDSAYGLLGQVAKKTITIQKFRDGFLPYQGAAVKEFFESLKMDAAPDL